MSIVSKLLPEGYLHWDIQVKIHRKTMYMDTTVRLCFAAGKNNVAVWKWLLIWYVLLTSSACIWQLQLIDTFCQQVHVLNLLDLNVVWKQVLFCTPGNDKASDVMPMYLDARIHGITRAVDGIFVDVEAFISRWWHLHRATCHTHYDYYYDYFLFF